MVDDGARVNGAVVAKSRWLWAIAVVLLATLLAAALWRDESYYVARQELYWLATKEWRDHLGAFTTERAAPLRAYFEDGKNLAADDPNRDAVLALADVRLFTMDAVMYAADALYTDEYVQVQTWSKAFRDTFQHSPVLCQRHQETRERYLRLFQMARVGCGQIAADLN